MNQEISEKGARMLLEGLGINLSNPNIVETPSRLAKALMELCRGLSINSSEEIKKHFEAVFPTTYRGMVIVNPIDVISLCSHHILPVTYNITFGYLPGEYTLGFSKIAKIINLLGSKPTLQEDFTQEIIDLFDNALHPSGVIVVIKGEHGCMRLRGDKIKSTIVTSALRGKFKTHQQTRNEFFVLTNCLNN